MSTESITSIVIVRGGIALAEYSPPPAPAATTRGVTFVAGEREPLIKPESKDAGYGAAAVADPSPRAAPPLAELNYPGLAMLPALRTVANQMRANPVGRISVPPRSAIHYLSDPDRGQLVIAVQCSEAYPPRAALILLKSVHDRIKDLPGLLTCPSMGLQPSAQPLLRQCIDEHRAQFRDAWTTAREQLDDVKGVMISNIEQVLSRGDKLEDLVSRTDALNTTAVGFHARARSVAQDARARRWRAVAAVVVVGLLVVFAIVWASCGFPSFDQCAPRR
ncbi:Vesicle-associated membrane protein [Blastocladiella emersonii ATCC 22665]|nr:Vesicle-associated membrane protein [Blastocladiella emersonii ATCC 22665]